MRLSLLALVLWLAGCSSNGGSAPIQPATADIPAVPPTASGAPVASSKSSIPATAPLRFVWTDFHFEVGTSVLEVEGRKVVETFSDHRMKEKSGQRYTEVFHRRATYELSSSEHARLKAGLSSQAFWGLGATYINRDIEDGTTQTFTVTFGDRRKDVYCYHQWPGPVADVRGILRDIRQAHEGERKRAPEADPRAVEAAKERADMAAELAGRKLR